MKDFSIIILCAGFGKRMLDLTLDTPKPLLKFDNTTLLGNAINFFKDIGFNEIFINTHYLHYKIENYIKNKFNNHPVNIIYEPSILGTGGGVKNIFNYTNNKIICVANSDILWKIENKSDILNLLGNFNDKDHCKLLLSKNINFNGLKKTKGDFIIKDDIVSNWITGSQIIYYSGFQIVSKNVFNNTLDKFSMNEVWNKLIDNKSLKGTLMKSKISHIGDKNSFDKL